MVCDKWDLVAPEIQGVCRTHARCGWARLQAEVLGPCAPPNVEFLALRRITSYLAVNGLGERAQQLIDRHESEAPRACNDRDLMQPAYTALRYALIAASRGTPKPDPDEIDWTLLRNFSWAQNVRLELATRTRRRTKVLDALRAARGRSRPTAFERGERSTILGQYYCLQGNLDRSRRYFMAARRAYAADSSCDTVLAERNVAGYLGVIALNEGQLDHAEDLVATALSHMTCRVAPDALLFRNHLAVVLTRRGEFETARECCLDIIADLDCAESSAGQRNLDKLIPLLRLGQIAVLEDDAETAREYQQRAEDAVGERGSAVIDANLHLLAGRIHGLGTSETSYRTAVKEFDAARRCYESVGDGLPYGIYKVTVYAGHLHVKHSNVEAALREALRCVELGQKWNLFPAFASGLLLKSQLLLQEHGSFVDRLYEEVLRGLHAIRSPRVLFRVVANLYLHSWNRQGDLDLTAHHLAQINKMKEFLDSRSYEHMYERYVAQPILNRTLVGNFGQTPIETTE